MTHFWSPPFKAFPIGRLITFYGIPVFPALDTGGHLLSLQSGGTPLKVASGFPQQRCKAGFMAHGVLGVLYIYYVNFLKCQIQIIIIFNWLVAMRKWRWNGVIIHHTFAVSIAGSISHSLSCMWFCVYVRPLMCVCACINIYIYICVTS